MNTNHVNYIGNEAAPQTAIDQALTDLESIIEGIHDSLSVLERRFGRVLLDSQSATEKPAGGPVPVAAESDMLAHINSLKRRVISANNRIAEILQRAQL